MHHLHVNVNVSSRFIQRRVVKHLYCAVCAGSDEIGSFSAIVWSCCWWAPGGEDCPVASYRLSDQLQRRPDDRKCWAGNVVRSGDVEWLTVNDVGWECLRLVCRSRPGTQEPCSADSDALWLPVCSGYVLRRASAIPHAASVTRRAAAFSTHCSLSVMYLGDQTKTALQ